MAKRTFEVAVAFAPQVAEGDYNDALDVISATLSGDPDGTDDGLILGDPGSGIGESGLSFGLERVGLDKANIAGSFTKSISDWLRVDVPTFSFSFPMVGNKTATTTPVHADFVPGVGLDALLQGAGMVGADAATGTGREYKFGSPNPISALIYINGLRIELLDCTVPTFRVNFTPGGLAIATADIAVGSVKDPASDAITVASLPTLDYGPQADVSSPVVETVGNFWQDSKGWTTAELAITQASEDTQDSNAANGIVTDATGRTTTFAATVYEDDADGVMEAKQLWADVAGDLELFTFLVGDVAGAGELAKAVRYTMNQPEVATVTPTRVGSKAANDVALVARAATANDELVIAFR